MTAPYLNKFSNIYSLSSLQKQLVESFVSSYAPQPSFWHLVNIMVPTQPSRTTNNLHNDLFNSIHFSLISNIRNSLPDILGLLYLLGSLHPLEDVVGLPLVLDLFHSLNQNVALRCTLTSELCAHLSKNLDYEFKLPLTKY